MKNTNFMKVLRRVRNHWAQLLASLTLALVNVVMTLWIPILVGQAIDGILGPGDVDMDLVIRCLYGILACASAAALSQWIMNELNNRITYSVTRDIRREVFAHIQELPVGYLDSHPHGDLVSRVISDVDTFADGLLMGFTQFFTGIMTIFGTLLFMFRVSWQIALVVVIITPVSLLVAGFIAKKTYDMFRVQTNIRGQQTALIDESVNGIKTLKAFGREDETLSAFGKVNDQLKKASLQAIFFSSLVNPSTRFVNSLVYAGVALVGAMMAISGNITVGNLSSFLNYANQYTKPFNEISGVLTELQNALACAGRVFELLEVPTRSPEPENPEFPDQLKGNIEARDLKFSYTPEKPLFRDIDLSVKSGQRVALVGPTGCGKTTLINLLMRFYDPEEGSIHLDGVNTQNMDRGQLRRCVGMVLQDTWLMAGTIRENITMGKPDATDEEVVAAAKKAHAHGFIKRLPKGYDTVIGESGGSLSQGQKQLLCIARVMLCLPPMLFLDEATSSIDTRTEMKIQEAFNTMMQGRTSFIVAHRLSTIQEADVILVMRDGRIVEQGSHRELLDRGGFYCQLYQSQFAH